MDFISNTWTFISMLYYFDFLFSSIEVIRAIENFFSSDEGDFGNNGLQVSLSEKYYDSDSWRVVLR